MCYDDFENEKKQRMLRKFELLKETEVILKFDRNYLKYQWKFYAFVLYLCQLLWVNRIRNGKFSRAK